MKILIADDNPQNMYMAHFLLENSGHQVIEAVNGEEAVQRTRENRPDAVLMDMQMPVLDGLQATQAIKADPSIRDIPVIAFTALAMSGDIEKTEAAGCDAYISKPINPATFVAQIEAVLT